MNRRWIVARAVRTRRRYHAGAIIKVFEFTVPTLVAPIRAPTKEMAELACSIFNVRI
jgi:hypothetical protein